ncbi:LxmA leader domain family RiPP [Streptomyces clavuligerus]|nr:LxmA leader domain family RiPP [Streptomyces clavuligerus]
MNTERLMGGYAAYTSPNAAVQEAATTVPPRRSPRPSP